MTKGMKLVLVILVSVLVVGCQSNTNSKNDNFENYQKAIKIMVEKSEEIDKLALENANDVGKLTSAVEEVKKEFQKDTDNLLNKDTQEKVFNVTFNELSVLFSSYEGPITLKNMKLTEGDSDEVVVPFVDKNKKEGEIHFKFQTTDNLISFVSIVN